MKLKTIIVDDEPLARNILKKYIQDYQELDLVAVCKDGIEALQAIKNNEVDLIFLDINMPKISGIELAKSIDPKHLVIFTTAYPEYAVEGFELNALDYLVKPIEFERFIRAVKKAESRFENNNKEHDSDRIFIKSDRKLIQVNYDDILYIQAYGDYIKVHTKNKVLLSKNKLSIIEQSLPEKLFIKVHRSYIVHLNAIDYLEGKHLKIKDAIIPISESNLGPLMSRLKTTK
ncbi:MAG: LytTR family DNA-binding domain-containing protein [Bacteroidota bacterium]